MKPIIITFNKDDKEYFNYHSLVSKFLKYLL